jgi:hypothetical protein
MKCLHSSKSFEATHGLCPVEDRLVHGAERSGPFPSPRLTECSNWPDASSRCVPAGKARVSAEVAGIPNGLQTSPGRG